MDSNQKKIFSKVQRTIRQKGIPVYLKKWKPPNMNKKFNSNTEFFKELNQYMRSYHKHAFIWVESKKEKKKKSKKKVKNPLPEFYFSNGIGRIVFYYFEIDSDKPEKSSNYKKSIHLVKKKLTEWKKKGCQGLIIDLRKHTGGWFQPFVLSMSKILSGSTLFAWSNKKVLKSEKKWINLNGKVKYNVGFKDDLNLFCPVAVLIGKKTCSSGEFAAAIFYRGNNKIRVFGEPTCGLLSVNQSMFIEKNVMLGFPVSLTTTVDGVFRKNERLTPDIITKKPLEKAKQWLKN
jgi:C-terminal processing protease CtpA/Prc